MQHDENDPFFLWKRNVIDEFKSLSEEEIAKQLKLRSNNFAVLMTNVIGDFNIGTVIRSANFHGANEFYYYGRKRFDRRSCVGVHNYTPVNFLSTIEEVGSLAEKYTFIALENNVKDTISMYDFDWRTPKPPLIIVGEESVGIQDEVIKMCNHKIEIPNYGSVRSINVGSAASIAMHDYVYKKNRNNRKVSY